ncbi:FxLYD domain-containing protein, partial [Kitasatospora sp. NPDC093806]|uniref:FxLYD domain-containing protein n=1 Tax=Kitasatospora sp. NPDC093806 TaxID=3155075 RepID=UPI003448F0E4
GGRRQVGRPDTGRGRGWGSGDVVGAAVLGGAALAGCSSDAKPSSAISSAAAAVESGLAGAASAAASAVGSAVASAAGGLSSVAASAEAAASSALADVKGGLDAKADVALGAVTVAADGKAEVTLTVTNHGQQANRYVVQVNFTDDGGNLLDATVVTVPDVAAGQQAEAKARSNRGLSNPVKAVVANAVRY